MGCPASRRKRREAAQTTHRQTLQALIDADDQPVFAVDRELRYTAFNSAHADAMRGLYGAVAGGTANRHWGTSLVTSADPTGFWPLLPPKSTWLWKGRLQGATFTVYGWGLHSIQEQWTGCNENRGLRAYVTWVFENPWDVYGQSWVLRDRGHRH